MQQWVSVWMGVTPRETVGLQYPALVVVLMRHTITEWCQVVHFRLQHSCIRKFSPILGLHQDMLQALRTQPQQKPAALRVAPLLLGSFQSEIP